VDGLLRAELGPGEAEAITLAVQRGRARLLLDERQARRVAEIVYGLSIRVEHETGEVELIEVLEVNKHEYR
jgi:predicted nucleic acid-binding protein